MSKPVVFSLLLAIASASIVAGQHGLDGLWLMNGTTWPTVVANAAPDAYVLNIGNLPGLRPSFGNGLIRPGIDNRIVDIYTSAGNYTVYLSSDFQTANVTAYTTTSPVVATLTRVATAPIAPKGSPDLDGAWDSDSGFVGTCLRSKSVWYAYFCLSNLLLPNGTVFSAWETLVQNTTDPYAFNVYAGALDSNAVLSKDGKTLMVYESGVRVATQIRNTSLFLVLPGFSPHLAGVFVSDPQTQIMICGTPESTPATALCVGSGLSPFGPYTFNVVERQSPTGFETTQIASVGAFSSSFSDGGNFKRQYLLGLLNGPLLAVGYRTNLVQSLRGSMVFGNVTAVCSGEDEEAITCTGSKYTGGALNTFNLAARGLGFGQYEVNFVYQVLGQGFASYEGPLQVSPDGMEMSFNTSAVVYQGLSPNFW